MMEISNNITSNADLSNHIKINNHLQINGNLSLSNHNQPEISRSQQVMLIDKSSPTFISIIFVLGTLIFVGNAMVCFAYYKVKTLRTLTNKLVISTSVSGMFVGLLFVPFFLVLDEVTRRQITDGLVVPVSSFLASFLEFSLLFNVAALTYERYVAVFCSLRYNCLVTNARINRALIVVWLVPLFLSTLPSVLPLLVDDHVRLFIFFKLYQGFLSSVLSLIILGFFAVYISVWRVSLVHIAFDRRQKLSLASTVLAEQLREFNSNMHNTDNIEGQQKYVSCFNNSSCRFRPSSSYTDSLYGGDDDTSKRPPSRKLDYCCCNIGSRFTSGCLLVFNTIFSWYQNNCRPPSYDQSMNSCYCCCFSCGYGSNRNGGRSYYGSSSIVVSCCQDDSSKRHHITSMRMEIIPSESENEIQKLRRSHDNNVTIDDDDGDIRDNDSSISEAVRVLDDYEKDNRDNDSVQNESHVCLMRRKVAVVSHGTSRGIEHRTIRGSDNFGNDTANQFYPRNNSNTITNSNTVTSSESKNNDNTKNNSPHALYTPERFPSTLSITINDDAEDLVLSQPTTPPPRRHRKRRSQNHQRRPFSESSTNTVQSPRKLSVDWQPRTHRIPYTNTGCGKNKDKRSRKISAPPAFRPWMREVIAAGGESSLLLAEGHSSREQEDFGGTSSLVRNGQQASDTNNNGNHHRRLSDPYSFSDSKNRRRRRKSSVLTTRREYRDFAMHAAVDLDKVVDQLNKIRSEMEEKRKRKSKRRKSKTTAPARQTTVALSNDKHSSPSPLLGDVENTTISRTTDDNKSDGFNSSWNSSSYTTTSYNSGNSSSYSTGSRNSPASIVSNGGCCHRNRSHNNSVKSNRSGICHLDRCNNTDCTQGQHRSRSSSSPRSRRAATRNNNKRPLQRSRVSFARCDSTSVSKLDNARSNTSTRSSLNRRNPSSTSPQQPNKTDTNNAGNAIKNQIIKGIIKKRSSNLSNTSSNCSSRHSNGIIILLYFLYILFY